MSNTTQCKNSAVKEVAKIALKAHDRIDKLEKRLNDLEARLRSHTTDRRIR